MAASADAERLKVIAIDESLMFDGAAVAAAGKRDNGSSNERLWLLVEKGTYKDK